MRRLLVKPLPRSFGSVLDSYEGKGPGFDLIRVALSVSVLCFHSLSLTGQPDWAGMSGYPAAVILPAFFAVSGFLVIASAIRTGSLATFLMFRGLRILPALCVEVTISAVVLGPIATNMTLSDYFTDPEFFLYFQNIIGNVHYFLPGVFANNPERAVNGSLWTIRPEIFCYLTLAVLMIARLHGNFRFYVGLTAFLFVVSIAFDFAEGRGPGFGQTFFSQEMYFFHFIVGNLAFHARYYIPYRKSLFAFAALSGTLLLQAPGFEILAAFPIVYCAIFMGLSRLPTFELLAKNDYSYGIYLFAYPIQQFAVTFPSARVWHVNILIALPITALIAAASWHLVEKPFLSLKRRVQISQAAEKRILGFVAVRFALSLVIFIYGAFLCKWSGLFGVWGGTMKQARPEIIMVALFGSLLTTFLGRSWQDTTSDNQTLVDGGSSPQLADPV